jgi:hypothetical protein
MSEIGDMWKEHKEERKTAKQERAANAPELLKEAGIVFDSRNNGQHLIVEGFECFIDFWPSTGRWNSRFGKQGFGLGDLIKYVKGVPS